jgi:hypothetical protein
MVKRYTRQHDAYDVKDALVEQSGQGIITALYPDTPRMQILRGDN